MEFFDRKEEVIDIQLTQYGKHVLSKGKFRPVYYAFYDDDVIYDARFAVSVGENQKVTEDRIKNTPRIKSQYSFSGRELKANKIDTGMCKGQMSACNKLQVSKEKHYGLGLPLGTSEVNTSKYPAWAVRFFKGALSDATQSQQATKEEVEFTFLSDEVEDYLNTETNKSKYIDLYSVSGKIHRFYFLAFPDYFPWFPNSPPQGTGPHPIYIYGLTTKEQIAGRFIVMTLFTIT